MFPFFNYLKSTHGVQTDYFWMWLGILVLFGYTIVFNGERQIAAVCSPMPRAGITDTADRTSLLNKGAN